MSPSSFGRSGGVSLYPIVDKVLVVVLVAFSSLFPGLTVPTASVGVLYGPSLIAFGFCSLLPERPAFLYIPQSMLLLWGSLKYRATVLRLLWLLLLSLAYPLLRWVGSNEAVNL